MTTKGMVGKGMGNSVSSKRDRYANDRGVSVRSFNGKLIPKLLESEKWNKEAFDTWIGTNLHLSNFRSTSTSKNRRCV